MRIQGLDVDLAEDDTIEFGIGTEYAILDIEDVEKLIPALADLVVAAKNNMVIEESKRLDALRQRSKEILNEIAMIEGRI